MPKIWIYVVETETIAIANIDMVPSSCACSKADHLYPSIHAKSGNASQSVTLQIDVTNFPISLRLPTDRPTDSTNEWTKQRMNVVDLKEKAEMAEINKKYVCQYCIKCKIGTYLKITQKWQHSRALFK